MNEAPGGHPNQSQEGWGLEKLEYPEGVAYISARWDLCVGCGHCEVACSMYHYGIINRELSRIRIFRYLLPLPKTLQNVCSQCSEEERECQKACPEDPPDTPSDTPAPPPNIGSTRSEPTWAVAADSEIS